MEWRARCAASARYMGALGMVALVLLSGCQGWGGQRLEPWLESTPLRYRPASPPPFPRPEVLEDGSGGGTRATTEGVRLVPGSAEHLAQAWVDYQFRHPGKYPRFEYAPDSTWERMYRTVLENQGQGGEFEQKVLKSGGYEKNTAMMLPPPSRRAEQGFIPDSVVGNPEELVWGKPYRFIEVKGRAEMALTGNLKAMLQYVETHGGHVEVWFRSAQHDRGQTQLTSTLRKQFNDLFEQGQAQIRWYP